MDLTWRGLRGLLARSMMEIILLVICVALAFKAPNFFTVENLMNVLRSVSMQGLIAFGMTLVIIVGEIDLSVGANVAYAGCLIAFLTQRGWPIPIGFMVAVALGVAFGSFIGVVRTRYAMPSFISSLALFSVLKGGALM